MKLPLGKKELVAMLMESPLYFDLRLRDRLELVKDQARRLLHQTQVNGLAGQFKPLRPEPVVRLSTSVQSRPGDGQPYAGLVVGYFPPPKRVGR
jgi:hypothetical protein